LDNRKKKGTKKGKCETIECKKQGNTYRSSPKCVKFVEKIPKLIHRLRPTGV